METIRDILRLKNILMNKTNITEGNVHYGNYPHIGYYKGKMKIFSWTERLRNWFLPFGVPLVQQTMDNSGLRSKYIGYAIGDDLFVHQWLFNKFLQNSSSEILYSPVTGNVASLLRSGWEERDTREFEKFVWRLAIRSTGYDFQKILQLDFETKANVDYDLLFRDSWLINRCIGTNGFYGIITTPTYRPGNNRVLWYSKYLVLVDLQESTGISVFSELTFNGAQHPHIRGNRLCEGGYAPILHGHIQRGEITDFFLIMKDFLRQYNPQSPYFSLPLSRDDALRCSGIGRKYCLSKMGYRVR